MYLKSEATLVHADSTHHRLRAVLGICTDACRRRARQARMEQANKAQLQRIQLMYAQLAEVIRSWAVDPGYLYAYKRRSSACAAKLVSAP